MTTASASLIYSFFLQLLQPPQGGHRAPPSAVSPAVHLTGYLSFLVTGAVINSRVTDFPLHKSLNWQERHPNAWEPLLS